MIYISGPITGVENFQNVFSSAVTELVYHGYAQDEIINPACNNYVCKPGKLSWKQYMDVALVWLSFCDEIFMLKGWENSKGAKLEHEYAKASGYRIIYQR